MPAMSSISTPVAMSPVATREPNFALFVGLAWLLVVGQLLAENWAATAVTLPDADDAMRLVQVRDFLAGQGWFDLHSARLNPPFGYDSHWSRLIDAGLAGLFIFFNHFTDAPFAERLMLTVWPMLWLLPSVGAVAAIAWRLGGREAAVIVLLLAAFAIPGFQQFRPGRIDHHNVHIALTLLATAAAVWSDRLRWCAWAAGGISGLAIAIGFESLAFYALFGTGFALRYVVDRSAAGALRAYAMALAASTLAAFFVTVGPDRWTASVCDMIAINSAAAVITAGVGLIVAATFVASERRWARFVAAAVAAGMALAVFILFEPRCLAGPFGLIDPAIRPIWLDNVSEAQPLSRILREAPLTGMAMASFPVVALLALLIAGGSSERRRDIGFLLASASFLLAVATTLGAVREYSYAIWLGLPFVAAAAAQVFAALRVTGLVPRFMAAVLITPAAITLGTIAIAQATGQKGLDLNSPERQACVAKENYAPLARLPIGLVVVNTLEWSPYILAWTPQAMLAAPYHRMSAGIIASHQALALPPSEARGVINRVGVTYVVACGSDGPEGMSESERAVSLWSQLQAGAAPDWLERLPVSRDAAFTIYLVKR
jgi:hypothetical protein